jgi:predicted nucleotidyltransferase
VNPLDIKPCDLETVKEILLRHVPDRVVRAFGSRVTGKAKKFSGLDLVVMGENPLSLSVVSALAEDFTESDLPFKVDVVDWATTKDAFREIIEKKHVVVQNGDEKKKEHVG